MIKDQAKEYYENKAVMQKQEELWHNGIEMLIGANFLRSMKGGIRIEGDEITIYKKVTKIKTSNQTKIAEIAELEVNEEEFLEINESIYFNQEGSKAFLEQFKPVIESLKHQGYIGEEPLKHWKKNGELCKLDIINPDVTIEDRPLKHVTPAMEDLFKKYVDSLLKIGTIRPSKSRHRTMAMIVNSGTTIDPVTGKEVKGKERMVFNYKSLKDNTYKDQYSLPGINTIIKRIGVKKIKEQVKNLPDLEIPPEDAYIILETDGCMKGWGGIVKWKKNKGVLQNAQEK
nr:retrotransposon protein, putative, Ty3-gypsy subclass [Tanacetum cinerariifolium]